MRGEEIFGHQLVDDRRDEDGRQQEQGEHERFQGLLHSLGWDRPFYCNRAGRIRSALRTK